MCGIAGIVGPRPSEATVARMTRALRHRGPDGDGFWSGRNVALGHRRLRIIDLSDAARQPMQTPDGRFTLVFNGEVYNYLEIRRELTEVSFRSTSDTEVLLHAFAKWGVDCLKKFVGMYAIAIWDDLRRELVCVRDPLGIKPFYYTEFDGHFVFASEISALLRAGAPRTADDDVIYDFLARDFYDHSNRTFFRNILQLPAGTWMRVTPDGRSEPRQFWNLGEAAAALKVPGSREDRAAELVQRMEDAVSLHLRSDVPVGVALSGGLDSATLLGLLGRVHADPSRISAFSFDFDDPAYSERTAVDRMATHTGHPVEFATVTPDAFAADAVSSVEEQQEPHAGLPIYAYSRCFRRARESGCIVVMDGSGLDEGMAGYQRFRPAYWADLHAAGRVSDLERELAAAGVEGDDARRRARAAMAAAASPAGDIGVAQDLTTSARHDCLGADFVAASGSELPRFARPFPDALRNLMFRELRYTKLPRALRFRDRLSMAHGCELRPPFLDHRLLAYQFALPAEDRIHDGQQKVLAREAVKQLLPAATRLASKRSVQTPQREWFRGPLRAWVMDQLDRPSFWQRGWVDRSAAMNAVSRFMAGEGDNSFFIWQWINLAVWAEKYLGAAETESSSLSLNA
jgi:asparagine synthase (glutamine-hydrolysing)